MSTDPQTIRADRFAEIGQLIEAGAEQLVDGWSRRAVVEQDSAEPAHRAEMRNSLPEFLRAVGRSLQESGESNSGHCLVAYQHGEQRWNVGWQLSEVVRDFELLRIVLLEHLDTVLERPLELREIMAVGLYLDESIGASVSAYVAFQNQSLSNIQQRVRAVVDTAADGIVTIDSTGVVEFINHAAERIFGYRSDEIVGKNVSLLMHSPDRDQHDRYLAAYRQAGERRIIGIGRDVVARHKDGRDLPIHLAIGEFQQDGQSHFTAVIHDISERLEAERALRESEGRFRGTFENAAVGIAHVDFLGRWVRVNQKLCDVVGYGRDELLRLTFQDITHSDDLAADLEQFGPLVRGEIDSYRMEKRYFHKNGGIVWINLTVSLQRDSVGKPEYCIAIVEDIQSRKLYEAQLAEAREQADRANRSKSDFLARMSHEIRTPMTAIVGFADLLDEQLNEASNEARDAIEVIRDNGHELVSLINEILDLSKIEAGKLDVRPEPCQPTAILDDVDSLMRVLAEKKGLAFETSFAGPDNLTVVTDAARLRQVLVNLVANAIKYTESGSVACLGAVTSVDGADALQFRVIDTGPGMTSAEAAQAFEPFHQVEGRTAANSSGLGLTISKHLITALGGKISVHTAPGQGCEFQFTVAAPRGSTPSSERAADALPTTSASVALSIRILAADDRRENRYLIQKMIEAAGAEVEIVADGRQAIDAAERAAASGRPFDVMLFDMHMPGVDGYEAVRILRSRGCAAPIIALTASAMDDDRRRCLEAGCNTHVAKPIDRDRLLAEIAALLPSQRG